MHKQSDFLKNNDDKKPPDLKPKPDPKPDPKPAIPKADPPGEQSAYATVKTGGSHATVKTGGCLSLRDSSVKEERQTKGASSQSAVVVDSFEKLIVRELASLAILGTRADMAVEYYRKNKDKVDAKDNPMGWIIQGVQRGWVSDVVQQQKKEPVKEKRIEEDDFPKAREFLKALSEKTDQDVVRVYPTDYHFDIDLRKEKRRHPLPLREPKSYRTLWSVLSNNQQETACTFFKSELPEFILTLINGKGENHACI